MERHGHVVVYTGDELTAKVEAIYAEFPMLRGIEEQVSCGCCIEEYVAQRHGRDAADAASDLADWLFLLTG